MLHKMTRFAVVIQPQQQQIGEGSHEIILSCNGKSMQLKSILPARTDCIYGLDGWMDANLNMLCA